MDTIDLLSWGEAGIRPPVILRLFDQLCPLESHFILKNKLQRKLNLPRGECSRDLSEISRVDSCRIEYNI